ncbi:MAG TPA: MBL fold metallo-hydrolase [Pyrinomonadaceae bacterium]|jgi:L-ascorbate metabolism protein UlaG (beta-lactamase superfamily)
MEAEKSKKLIEPVLSDDAFLDDVRRVNQRTGNAFHLWWLGQSGFLLQWRGRHLLFDPYLSDSLTVKYETTDKPHVRMTRRVIAPERLDFIDVVTSSHNHTDHLDGETLRPLLAANKNLEFIIPSANREFVAERVGRNVDFAIGLNDGESVEINEFTITGVAAAHESLEQDELGRHKFLNYLVSFGPWTVYHSSDCVPYDGLPERINELRGGKMINVALLPINGRKPERRVTGNFWGDEAARLAAAVGAETVIPMHYEMFEFNTETPDLFASECRKLEQNYHILRGGGRFSRTE